MAATGHAIIVACAVRSLAVVLSVSVGAHAAPGDGTAASKPDADNIVEAESARGPYGSLGAGFGLLSARLFAGHLTGDHSTYVPVFLSVGAQFTAW